MYLHYTRQQSSNTPRIINVHESLDLSPQILLLVIKYHHSSWEIQYRCCTLFRDFVPHAVGTLAITWQRSACSEQYSTITIYLATWNHQKWLVSRKIPKRSLATAALSQRCECIAATNYCTPGNTARNRTQCLSWKRSLTPEIPLQPHLEYLCICHH